MSILLRLTPFFLLLLLLLQRSQALPKEATIAFHIITTPETLAHLPRLFDRLYHPDNLFLLEYTHPLDPTHHSRKLNLPNVFHRASENYVQHGISHVLALLNGMAFFLDRESALAETSFDYFIHLTPHTYPAMNATHVRRMLAFDERSYPPPNFLQAIHPSQWRLFSKEIDFLYTDLTLAYNSTLETQPMLETHNFTHPDRHRRILKLPRTDEHVILNHETVRQATDSMLAKRLLLTLGDTSHAVNRFFGGLVENCKDPIGRVITKTNLRCVNTKAFRMEVTHVLPEYRLLMPSVAFLRATSEPCLFVGFANVNTDVLDEIDRQLIIAPGLMGKPMGQGFHDIVRERLTAVLGNMPG